MSESKELTVSEQSELTQCEEIIERGAKHFVAVGSALATIRDQRLYRATHTNFETYLRDRWHRGRDWAEVTINAAAVIDRLPTEIGNPPNSVPRPSVARRLLEWLGLSSYIIRHLGSTLIGGE